MDIDDIDHELGAAVERSLGRRGTYLDAHRVTVAYLNEKTWSSRFLAAAVGGWALVLAAALHWATH